MMRATFTVRATGLALCLAALAGCQREAENLAEFSGHIFVFNYRLSRANYVVTLRPTGPLPEGGVALARFDNPQGGAPLITRQALYPKMDKVVLESPDVQCVREGKSYGVHIELADRDGKVLQELETRVLATIDQSILPANSIVVGPAYDMNPKVFKAGGVVDLSPVPCPT
jgi:hypothetical protein